MKANDTVLEIGDARVLVKYTFHPKKGDFPSYHEVLRVELATTDTNLLPLLDELDATSYIEAQLSLKEAK